MYTDWLTFYLKHMDRIRQISLRNVLAGLIYSNSNNVYIKNSGLWYVFI